jgi:2-C-methyl-D-erythritol 4-phosphate cytidylyltransferase
VKVALLLLAAGRGTRFGGPIPKAWLELAGRPLLAHCIERLHRALPPGSTAETVILVHDDDRPAYVGPWLDRLRLLAGGGPVQVVTGGPTRQSSMLNGLAAIGADCDLVLIHDAARALLPIAATTACLAAAEREGAALLAIPAPDTLKRVEAGRVCGTIDRTGVWLAQTPQVIRRDLLRRAAAHAEATGFVGTDDVALVEHLGERVVAVPGSATNLKITRPEDLPLAAAILSTGLA